MSGKLMTKAQRDYVKDTIECEGFQYAFEDYTDFPDIEDETFHELRRNFLKALVQLQDYIG